MLNQLLNFNIEFKGEKRKSVSTNVGFNVNWYIKVIKTIVSNKIIHINSSQSVYRRFHLVL